MEEPTRASGSGGASRAGMASDNLQRLQPSTREPGQMASRMDTAQKLTPMEEPTRASGSGGCATDMELEPVLPLALPHIPRVGMAADPPCPLYSPEWKKPPSLCPMARPRETLSRCGE